MGGANSLMRSSAQNFEYFAFNLFFNSRKLGVILYSGTENVLFLPVDVISKTMCLPTTIIRDKTSVTKTFVQPSHERHCRECYYVHLN